MVPDLQAEPGTVVEFDPRGSIDVRLYWQQWHLGSAVLERITQAMRTQAAAVLR